MKPDSIQAMLADPNIDPTEWVGKALMTWVKNNPATVLQDVQARKYLFNGMDIEDISVLSAGVSKLYRENQDSEMVAGFVKGLNKLQTPANNNSYGLTHSVSSCIREFQLNICNEFTIDHIVDIKHPGSCSMVPYSSFWALLKPKHAKKLILNRRPKWPATHLELVIKMIPSNEIFEFATQKMIPDIYLDKNVRTRYDDNPERSISAITTIFKYIPEEDAEKWLNWLNTTDFSNIWYGSEKVSKAKSYCDPWRLDDTVCPCGEIAASKSGSTLHRRKCYGGNEYISITQAAEVLVAKSGDKMRCFKCGRKCKTVSGLTLHTKSCESKAHELVDKMRRKEKDANKTENQVS